MVFKRPTTGRDDRQGRSKGKTSAPAGRPKRAYAAKEKSNDTDNKPAGRKPSGKYNTGPTGESAFSADRKTREHRPRSEGSSSSPAKKRPYSGRTADGPSSSGPKRSTGGTTARKAPYGTRGPAQERAPYKKPSGERSERGPNQRSFGDKPERSERGGGKRSFGDKPERSERGPSTRSFGDKPERAERGPGKRTFSSNSERPERGANQRPYGDKGERSERGSDQQPFGDKPFTPGRKPNTRKGYGGQAGERPTPVRTMRGRKKPVEQEDDGLIRLNRYIANAGICSRRKADELISAGVVAVNGVVISELGYKVDPAKDKVSYNGETLRREKNVYVLLNKPKDYITTTEDPQERRTVMHLVEKASKERIYPVGRLDRNTTGLLLMTNDGDLADKLSHPRNSIVKLYQVELSKSLTQGDLNKIAFGVELEDGLIKPDAISYVSGATKKEVGIQIHSGKNRIVRRIFEHLGYEVVKLDRVVYGNLTKKDLPRGRWRYLEENEIIQLKHLI
jgi:23S rRNA pseudouridine2605 synthase